MALGHRVQQAIALTRRFVVVQRGGMATAPDCPTCGSQTKEVLEVSKAFRIGPDAPIPTGKLPDKDVHSRLYKCPQCPETYVEQDGTRAKIPK